MFGKETYILEKRHIYWKRDIHIGKETYILEKRHIYWKRDIYIGKETYIKYNLRDMYA